MMQVTGLPAHRLYGPPAPVQAFRRGEGNWGFAFAAEDNAWVKTWTDRLPQIPFPYRGLPPDGPWMTQEEAASHLGIGPYHLNMLTTLTHRIDMVRTTGTELAVTRASVEAEKNWRTTATPGQKIRRLLKDILKAL